MNHRPLLLASVLWAAACGNTPATEETLGPDGPQVDVEQTAPAQDSGGDPNSLAMAKQNGAQIGLGTGETLQETAVVADGLGQTHTHYNRTYNNLPVAGGDFVLHQKGGSFLGFSSTLKTPVNVGLSPTLSAVGATAEALKQYSGTAVLAKVRLVVHAFGDSPKLAYDVVLYNDADKDNFESVQHTYIDAATGAYLGRHNDVMPTAAVGSGKSLYMGTLPLTANSITGGFELRDPDRGNGYTINMKNKSNGGTIFTDLDNVWGNSTTGDTASAAVDAHIGVAFTWDYFKNVHGRNGIANDGKGSYSRIHYGRSYNNAFWSDSCFCMTYGDGDGRSFKPLVSLDVAGHEMTHGVTARTAGLVYSGESGGLNESTSDIFGSMVEYYAANAADAGDYLIGEKITLYGNRWLRNMSDPRADGYSIDHYSQMTSSLDVHYSSGLANKFFHLLAEGGTNKTSGQSVTGIGRAKAEKIWYRALAVYMTTNTNFKGARTATVNAATDLHGAGSTEATTVAAAWTACGVN
ncbi:MAG TPA: M4 family metallopeptidase [Pseudomonadota bacterium]|nr:M4 family metallopeptidase [Pseudomonadota bacterium]